MTKATLLKVLFNVPDDEEIGIIDDQGKELDEYLAARCEQCIAFKPCECYYFRPLDKICCYACRTRYADLRTFKDKWQDLQDWWSGAQPQWVYNLHLWIIRIWRHGPIQAYRNHKAIQAYYISLYKDPK